MLTYNLNAPRAGTRAAKPVYEQLYEFLKEDILSQRLHADEHLPSKRAFAKQLGISVITVEHAYEQLISEGYVYALPKQGYFVAELSTLPKPAAQKSPGEPTDGEAAGDASETLLRIHLSDNRADPSRFPFSVWAKLMRENLATRQKQLLEPLSGAGAEPLRKAIADHLYAFRRIRVEPSQIVIGAGTEYLYGLLLLLLGKDKTYAVEDPGFQKISKIYEANGIRVNYIPMDDQGIRPDDAGLSEADILHISPTHHYPTGITMPVSRRYELLSWASLKEGRYIIEDDYDSEFRLTGRPIPALQSIDVSEKVIYVNTFSKSLTSNIRVSYLALPPHLARRYSEKLGFFSSTVSGFEQYTLARFMEEGHFEKQINRMRLHYARQRKLVLKLLRASSLYGRYQIIERDSGQHFLIALDTQKEDGEFKELLLQKGIGIRSLSEFCRDPQAKDQHCFLLNYSDLSAPDFEWALEEIAKIL